MNPRCLVHMVGSVWLSSADEVLRTTAEILGHRVKRLSGGEVGKTKNWINCHHAAFQTHPFFESYTHVERFDPRTPDSKRTRFRLKQGKELPQAATLASIGYADEAERDYRVLVDLKRSNMIAADARLLVAIPSPYDILNSAVDVSDFPAFLPFYEQHLFNEVARVSAVVPADELAIQWDAAHEFEYLATKSQVFHPFSWEEMCDLLVRLGNAVPPGIELGYHCCYGNLNLKHFVQPTDMGDMVNLMNAVFAELDRPVQFVHMPVPQNRTDEAYFAPLKELKTRPETELYLGLVHDSDGAEGSIARAATARRFFPRFGISTECGLAARTPENIRKILRIEAETAELLD